MKDVHRCPRLQRLFILTTYMRQRDLSLADAWTAHEFAQRLFVGREFAVGGESVLGLMADSKCSSYNYEYVALARELASHLVTWDRQILREFPAVAVSPTDFVAGST